MTLDHGQLVDQPIKTPYVAGVMSHQVDNHGRVDEVEVDEEIEMISDERPVHVREVVSDHEQDAKWTADPDHKSGDQRQYDQQMTPLHQEVGQGKHRRCRKGCEEIMEGYNMVEEATGAVVLQNLPASSVEKGPPHENAKQKDDAAIELGFSHINISFQNGSAVLSLNHRGPKAISVVKQATPRERGWLFHTDRFSVF